MSNTSPSDIEVICDDILEKGMMLETMSGMNTGGVMYFRVTVAAAAVPAASGGGGGVVSAVDAPL